MHGRRFGTLTYKSLAYCVLRGGTLLGGLAVTVALRRYFPMTTSPASQGVWSDTLASTLSTVPLLVAAMFGGRVIRRLWIVRPARPPS